MKIGALEAGGTKMVCAAGDEYGRVTAERQFPTETPETTLPQILAFFQEQGIEALGIGCFGPIDLHKGSPTYGAITSTPKLAWQDCRIVPYFQEALQIPVGFDTDVNASMLGELFFGAAKGLTDCLYLTVGTGIGAGILSGGQLVHGLLHPEAGHVLVQKRPEDPYTLSLIHISSRPRQTTLTRGTITSLAWDSPRSKTLLIISFSSDSRTPSSWLSSTRERS